MRVARGAAEPVAVDNCETAVEGWVAAAVVAARRRRLGLYLGLSPCTRRYEPGSGAAVVDCRLADEGWGRQGLRRDSCELMARGVVTTGAWLPHAAADQMGEVHVGRYPPGTSAAPPMPPSPDRQSLAQDAWEVMSVQASWRHSCFAWGMRRWTTCRACMHVRSRSLK